MNYWFDSRDCIAKVDQSWLPFARENGAGDLDPDAVRGRHLSTFISDPTTCELWQRLLQRARQGAPVIVTIRCDAPDCRRTLTLSLRPDRRRVRVTSTLVGREFRPTMPLLEKRRDASGAALVACSWCRRFELGGGAWVEVESLVESLRLFAQPSLPPVVESTCPACRTAIAGEIDRAGAGSEAWRS